MLHYSNKQIESLPNEEWRDIPGVKGYQASNLGRIKALNYRQSGKPGIITQFKNHKGYLIVSIREKTFTVHRLVAKSFIDNPLNKPQIDHIDTDRINNNVSNLRWCTQKENSNNKITKERLKESCLKNREKIDRDKQKKAVAEVGKKSGKKVKCITTGKTFNSASEGAKYYNAPSSSVRCAANPKCERNKYAGFIIDEKGDKIKLEWEYID